MRVIMRLIIALLLSCLVVPPLWATQLNVEQLNNELKQAETNKSLANQTEVVEALRSALSWQNELRESNNRAQQFQKSIDDFPKLVVSLRKQLEEGVKPKSVPANLTAADYEQLILQNGSQILDLTQQLQQEQELSRESSDSLSQIPQLQAETRRLLGEAEKNALSLPTTATTPLTQAQTAQANSEVAARKAQIRALELEQLSASNRQELSRLRSSLLRLQLEAADTYQQALRDSLNSQRQRKAELALEQTTQLAQQNSDLPSSVRQLLNHNRQFSLTLNQQARQLEQITQQLRQTNDGMVQVQQALTTLREQARWLSTSTILGDTLRAQVARMPEMPKPQQIDSAMIELRIKRIGYDEQLEQLRKLPTLTEDDGQPLPLEQQHLVDSLLKTQQELLNSLLSGSDNLILELTKLKVAETQLVEALRDLREATHRYLFWVADARPIGFSYPIEVIQDLRDLLSLDTFEQLGNATVMMLSTPDMILPISAALLLVIISIASRRHYYNFLNRASGRIGKVTQDHFRLTMRTVFWSILIALPIPVLWAALGFGLQKAWLYPIAVAIGDGITATLPVLWLFMIGASFASPQGLFISHFRWSPEPIRRVLRYYRLSIWFIVPLIMALISFENYNDREFSATLGRLCFILLCAAILVLTAALRRAGIPLYLDRNGSGDNLLNKALWWLLLFAPALAAIAASLGYLVTSQSLLARLESSVAIWFIILIIYSIIRRWMLIQRRRIAFERAKQRRADMLAQRARTGDDGSINADGSPDIEEPVIDLDAISAQSLRLVRSLLMLVALSAMIVLWSELHSAFGFLSNISLWDVNTVIKGSEVTQPITLAALLISILVLIITMQMVQNLPALLELTILQHVKLTPGTGYAITTISKYLIMLIGFLMAFSFIGIEWSKLQWLVAALSVGLGFGLQEIFANFISGLIILFEKPIRIGDTVTIRNLTGTITRIDTRATTLGDWDRKEIIVPNKAFITEQFINWSLTDSITRVVLTVPAAAEADSSKVCQLLLEAAQHCSLVLDNPAPEVYLIDIQQGVQIFEMRVFAAEMGHRLPIRHELHQLILQAYQQHGLTLP
ncbi:MAG: miniconductance mechanosensitive channel MscM, partial [Enterobacteriaceae bacterium]